MTTSAEYIEFPALPITQPIGTFWIGSIRARDLVTISYADIRRIEQRDIEKFVGIQRPLSEKRKNELQQYVRTVDASFPTCVILAIDSEALDEHDCPLLQNGQQVVNVRYDEKRKIMAVRNSDGVAQIIDGQHRIAGLEGYGGEFDVNVAIFIDMDMEDKGNVFATVNLQQTKVSKSLAYDLYEYARSRSPQKTAHNIAKLFNREDGSPFQQRIKILGTAVGGTHEFLTQAAFVERLLPMISSDPMDDRDRLKRGKKLERASDSVAKNLVFRNLFVDEQDAKIARILWNYFKAVAERWPNAWASNDPGNVLPRTSGFAALMRFFRPLYNSLGKPGDIVENDTFLSALHKSHLADDAFTRETYVPGTSGETRLYNDLMRALPDSADLFRGLG